MHGDYLDSFRSNCDDVFYSLNSWDLPKGISHLFLHRHILCTIMSHGLGVYPDMSQAVVSTGVYFCETVKWAASFGEFTVPDVCTYVINRFLGAHQCCRGSGGPCNAQLTLQGLVSLWGSEPAQFVLRSNRFEPGARRLACWWWSSLFLPCATYQLACWMSWKGIITSSADTPRIKHNWKTQSIIDAVSCSIIQTWRHVFCIGLKFLYCRIKKNNNNL